MAHTCFRGNSVAEALQTFDNEEIRTICSLNEAINVCKHCKRYDPQFGLLSLVTGTVVNCI